MFRILIRDGGYLHAACVEDAYYDVNVEVEVPRKNDCLVSGLCFNYNNEHGPAYVVQMHEHEANRIMYDLLTHGYVDLTSYGDALIPIRYDDESSDEGDEKPKSTNHDALLNAAYAAAPDHIV